MCKKFQMLLFSWPPACTVWTNYEVVLLQPWSGTAMRLVFIYNIMSYLNPDPPFKCLLDLFPSPSVSWLPPHPPLLDWSAPLFLHPILSLLFWSWIACPYGMASTTSGLHRTSCAHCIAALDLIPRSSSSPRRAPVSAASPPVCLPPFFSPWNF